MKVSELKQWPKVYEAFADNVGKHGTEHKSFEDFLDSGNRESINFGFCWDFSTQGYEFWFALFRGDVEEAKELCPGLFETEGELQQETGPAVESEGLIKWDGGDMPVPEDTVVDVKFRDGYVTSRNKAKYYYWDHVGEITDIVAYKLHTGGGYVDGVKVKDSDKPLKDAYKPWTEFNITVPWLNPEMGVDDILNEFKLDLRKKLNLLVADNIIEGDIVEKFDKLMREM